MGLAENEAPALIAQYGRKHDNIGFSEFVIMMAQVQRHKEQLWKEVSFNKAELQIFRETFDTIDVDGSGSIDGDELAAAVHLVGIGNDVSREDIDEIIAVYDEDGNGTIDFEVG
jgi:Ca2+-binding EF-hand superfamily protein